MNIKVIKKFWNVFYKILAINATIKTNIAANILIKNIILFLMLKNFDDKPVSLYYINILTPFLYLAI